MTAPPAEASAAEERAPSVGDVRSRVLAFVRTHPGATDRDADKGVGFPHAGGSTPHLQALVKEGRLEGLRDENYPTRPWRYWETGQRPAVPEPHLPYEAPAATPAAPTAAARPPIVCRKGCGKEFAGLGGRGRHETACTGRQPPGRPPSGRGDAPPPDAASAGNGHATFADSIERHLRAHPEGATAADIARGVNTYTPRVLTALTKIHKTGRVRRLGDPGAYRYFASPADTPAQASGPAAPPPTATDAPAPTEETDEHEGLSLEERPLRVVALEIAWELGCECWTCDAERRKAEAVLRAFEEETTRAHAEMRSRTTGVRAGDELLGTTTTAGGDARGA